MKPIFLWGFMASGKTKLGKRLAKQLNVPFIDLDKYIEAASNLSISDIFTLYGEDYFRKMEKEAIQELSNSDDIVVSCGGGSPCFGNNADIMNAKGTTIFLSVQFNEIINRLWRNRSKRPLVASINNQKELSELILEMLNKRMPFYRQAEFTYDNTYPKSNINELINLVKID